MKRLLLLFLPLALGAQPATTPEGFSLPQPGHVFSFPKDLGSHPDFRIEWWYVTGHLAAPAGQRFGFQSTFFRLAGPRGATDANPDFSQQEIFLAHMALTDISGGKFWHEERLNRGGWDAGSTRGDLDLHNGEWTMRRTPAGAADRPVFQLQGGVRADVGFRLTLAAAKPWVVFGENGVSRKGAEPSAASYYLTYARLAAEGTLTLAGQSFPVRGEAWMDHEISSSQVGRDQVGWDWVCVQFHREPRELMLYRMRRRDGTADPASRLQWVGPDSRARTAAFSWKVLSHWKSPHSGATYPARIELTATDPASGAVVPLQLVPELADQELSNSLGGGPYWEGACRVLDARGQEVGSGYLELTGYARPLQF